MSGAKQKLILATSAEPRTRPEGRDVGSLFRQYQGAAGKGFICRVLSRLESRLLKLRVLIQESVAEDTRTPVCLESGLF